MLGDEELRRKVESLLAQQTEAENFIEAPALEVAAEGMAGNSDQVTVSISSQGPSRVGQTVSHYRIVQKLGEGGIGVVYKAQDLKLKRWVALKFLPPQVSLDAEVKVRFTREAKAASALDHPSRNLSVEVKKHFCLAFFRNLFVEELHNLVSSSE